MTITKFLDPKNDVVFKKMFGTEKNKDILIYFLNDILELKDSRQIEDVEFLQTIQDPDIASKKQSIVDVLCIDKEGIRYIIEMQVAKTKGFEKRAQFYASKIYASQINKGSPYSGLKEVVFIAIADCDLFPDKKNYISIHNIRDIKTDENDLKDLKFIFIELPKFKIQKEDTPLTIRDKWLYFFKYAPEIGSEDMERIIGSDLVINKAYEAVKSFNWTEQELEFYEREVKRVMDEQAILEQKLDDAEAKGKNIGIKTVLQMMIRNGKSIHEISALTNLSIKEVRDILKE